MVVPNLAVVLDIVILFWLFSILYFLNGIENMTFATEVTAILYKILNLNYCNKYFNQLQ